MGKTNNPKTTQDNEPPVSDVSKVPSFPSAIAELSWKIALPFLVISLLGIKADEQFNTEPTFSLLGVLLSIIIISIVVYKFVKTNYPDTFTRSKK